MVTNEVQAESVLYGDLGAVSGKILGVLSNFMNIDDSSIYLLLFLFYSSFIWSNCGPLIHCFPCFCHTTWPALEK